MAFRTLLAVQRRFPDGAEESRILATTAKSGRENRRARLAPGARGRAGAEEDRSARDEGTHYPPRTYSRWIRNSTASAAATSSLSVLSRTACMLP